MADCKTCEKNRVFVEPVPYVVHEKDMARMERNGKRLWIAIILLIVLLVGSNIAWTIYESQFEYETVTEIDSKQETKNGSNYVVGGDMNG